MAAYFWMFLFLLFFSNRMPHLANFKTAVFHVVHVVFAKHYMCRVTVQSFDKTKWYFNLLCTVDCLLIVFSLLFLIQVCLREESLTSITVWLYKGRKISKIQRRRIEYETAFISLKNKWKQRNRSAIPDQCVKRHAAQGNETNNPVSLFINNL